MSYIDIFSLIKVCTIINAILVSFLAKRELVFYSFCFVLSKTADRID